MSRAWARAQRQLRWLHDAGVEAVDVTVRAADGTWYRPHRGVPTPEVDRRLGGWLRARNAAGADVYLRAAEGRSWPVVWLDDLSLAAARRIAARAHTLVVRTSPGRHHAWVRCDRPLDADERAMAQRALAAEYGADPASTDGIHWGRLAGVRSHKRGCWVDIVDVSGSTAPLHAPLGGAPVIVGEHRPRGPAQQDPAGPTDRRESDHSASGTDWHLALRWIDAGVPVEQIVERITGYALSRRKRDTYAAARAYAERTVRRALARRR